MLAEKVPSCLCTVFFFGLVQEFELLLGECEQGNVISK